MAIGDRITMVIYIIDFIEVYRYYRYFATTICVREREREREKKGQSRKKFKKKKNTWTYRNAIVCTEDKDKCSMQREFERGFSRKSRVGSWKKNKEKYQARKNVRWRGFLRSLS